MQETLKRTRYCLLPARFGRWRSLLRLFGIVLFCLPALVDASSASPTPPALWNGRIVFYVETSAGNWNLYTVQPNGTDRIQVTTSPESDYYGAFSPDGTTIVFSRDTAPVDNLGFEIWLINSDGSGERRLTSTADGAYDNLPTWSPDGTKVLFTRIGADSTYDLFTINRDGTGLHRLTHSPALQERWATFSPDGSKILYEGTLDGNREIFVMNADGTGNTNLTNSPARENKPDWSPDGSRIVYQFRPADAPSTAAELYTMAADGSDMVQVTHNTLNDFWPTWSPDGERILFLRNVNPDGAEQTELFTVRVDGSAEVQLTSTEAREFLGDWQALPGLPTLADSSALPSFLSPQGISPVPEGFSAIGTYVVATFGDPTAFDGRDSKLWLVPPDGGEPTLFAATLEDVDRRGYRGGLFLPPDFGVFGGQYAAIGIYGVTAFDANGTPTLLANTRGEAPAGAAFLRRGLGQPAMAPPDFGTAGGALLIPYLFGPAFADGGVVAIFPDGTVEDFAKFEHGADAAPIFPYGAVFAPPTFGAVGGQLLVNDGEPSGQIFALDAAGTIRLFTTVPVLGDQSGPRHMAFAGADFGPLAHLLFVSVARAGEGEVSPVTPGALYALDDTGAVVAFFDLAGLPDFEPRALHFAGDGRLFIGDGSRILVTGVEGFRLNLPTAALRQLRTDTEAASIPALQQLRLLFLLDQARLLVEWGETAYTDGFFGQAQRRFFRTQPRLERYQRVLTELVAAGRIEAATAAPLFTTLQAITVQLNRVASQLTPLQ